MFRLTHALRALLCVSIAPLIDGGAHAQDARKADVDRIFGGFVNGAGPGGPSPGCAVGVVQNGELVYRRGYGIANLDYSRPLDGQAVFYLASVSKQFTAAAVVIAASQGKLSLDDGVRRYIPELPEYAAPITIRHLIHHTSGLRDYLALIPLSGRRPDDYWSKADLLALIARQRSLNFSPGSEHLYSNTGYLLLAEIIQRATGQSLRVFAEEHIFDPLDMEDTHFHDDTGMVVPGRVIGYSREETGWRVNHWFNFDQVGDGGLNSTVEDLARWDANFYSGEVGGAALLAQLEQRGRLNTGDSLAYAFGLTHGRYRGLRTVEHNGSLAGFRTAYVRFPEQRFSAIVLCNNSSANAPALARSVADVYLRERLEPVYTTSARPTVGTTGPDTAAARLAELTRATELELRGRTRLGDFAGSFRSDELDAVYRFAAENDTLVLYRGGRRIPLRLAASDLFSAPTFALRFTRADGTIDGLTLDAGRVRGIRFDRVTNPR